jgi:hypothetical protein
MLPWQDRHFKYAPDAPGEPLPVSGRLLGSQHMASYMLAMCHGYAMITTIQLSPGTRSLLAELKENPRETYDEVVNKLLSLVPRGDEEGPYAHAFRVSLLKARIEIREGRTIDHARLKRRLNL